MKKISLPLAAATLGSASQSLEAATLETLVESTVQASLSWVAGKELAAGYEGAVSLARPEVVAMQSSMIPAAVLASVLIVAGATFGLAGEKSGKAGSTGEEASAVKLAGDDSEPAAKPLRDVAVQLAAADDGSIDTEWRASEDASDWL